MKFYHEIPPSNYYSRYPFIALRRLVSRQGKQRFVGDLFLTLFANLTKRIRRVAVPVSSKTEDWSALARRRQRRRRRRRGRRRGDLVSVPRRGLETVGQVGRSRNALRRPTSAQAEIT